MVRRPVLACLLAIAPWCAAAQDSLPPGILLLSRIKRHVREEMGRLPDYTCLETSQRYRSGAAGRGGLKPYDTMRVEVLYSGDKELYAAPGAHDFRSDGPDAFAAGGLFGTGLFALHLRTIFVNDNAMSKYAGEEELDGRRAVRYDYRVPLTLSGFHIVLPEGSGYVSTKGSFWADPQTLDLLRLDVDAADIPSDLPLAQTTSVVRYARTKIGDRSVMLPQTSEIKLVKTDGEVSRNVMEFTHCR